MLLHSTCVVPHRITQNGTDDGEEALPHPSREHLGAGKPPPPLEQEMQVQFLGQENPLEKEMATHSNILAWKIP